jgi:hypothetical protein
MASITMLPRSQEKMALQGMMATSYDFQNCNDGDLASLAGNSFNMCCIYMLTLSLWVHFPWAL